MLKGLFVSEDKLLLDRIKTGFSDLPDYEYLYTSSCEEAVNMAKENDIAICCIDLGTSVLDGGELADIVSDENPDVRFIFVYEEKYTELAVEMFNVYDGSKIILMDNFSVEELKTIFVTEAKSYDAENHLKDDAKAYREREKAYKKSMDEMSNILNQRVMCYKSIIKMYSAGINMIMPHFTNDEANKVRAFIESRLNDYVEKFVVSEIDFDDFFASDIGKINNTEAQKHYMILGADDVPRDETGCLMCYAISFISHGFCDFMDKYRVKVEIKSGPKAYRVDYLMDTRLSGLRREFLEEFSAVIGDICRVLCDKCEMGFKDGIMQFRLYYIRVNEEAEALP